jgi:hypothetical protein
MSFSTQKPLLMVADSELETVRGLAMDLGRGSAPD